VVFAVAAVDAYMHRLIVERADMWASLPKTLAATEIRFDQLVGEAKASYEAARREPFNSRPGVRTKQVLRRQLLLKTFQSPRQIQNALSMAGAGGNWGTIGQQLGMTRAQIDARLNGVVVRRNQIVHEGDYERLDRPQQASLTPFRSKRRRDTFNFSGI